ncbi:MAG TPA: peptide ABC transporter substrate-binding protein [Thermomicrobiales bacterium]|nr:peptide ABC transporter substrate-binding protein [Thermomicrobiales bacterium]
MTEQSQLDTQLAQIRADVLSGKLSRRAALKAIGVAAATATLAARGVSVAAQDASPAAGTGADEVPQIFYQRGYRTNPTSFDFNADLYCNADTNAFEGVTTFDADLNPAPGWAETWESNEDASVWTFHIRQNNTGWSDGTPVTAGDFVYSWARQLDPNTAAPYASFFFDVKNAQSYNTGAGATADDLGLKAIDDWTLEVTCEGPRGGFPLKAAYQAAWPAPKWQVEKYAEKWALGGDVPLVSNGPFNLVDWTPDVGWNMERNPGFWDAENISIATYHAPLYPAANEVLLFEEGEGDQQLDWSILPAADYARYLDDPDKAALLSPYVYPGLWMILPSNGIPPFDKLEVRKALSHAIDRDRLVTVTNGLVSPAYCMVPQGVFGFLDDPALTEIQNYDPELAMASLVGTEFEGGENWPEINMWMRAEEEVYNADIMANDIVDQLKQNLGMDVKINPVPQSNFTPQLTENKWQLVFIRWWMDYPDPDNMYGDMFYSQKASGKRQAWSNAEFDDLVIQGKEAPTPEARLEIYAQAEKIIQEDVGYMPLVFRLDQDVYKPWVQNVEVNQYGQKVPDGNIYVNMLRHVTTDTRPAE